jgi:hypothetical protein
MPGVAENTLIPSRQRAAINPSSEGIMFYVLGRQFKPRQKCQPDKARVKHWLCAIREILADWLIFLVSSYGKIAAAARADALYSIALAPIAASWNVPGKGRSRESANDN